jgi:hypothetical protein
MLLLAYKNRAASFFTTAILKAVVDLLHKFYSGKRSIAISSGFIIKVRNNQTVLNSFIL